MADNRERTSYVLFAAAALLAIVPLWLLLKYRSEYLGVALSTLLLALVPAGAALWNLLRLPGREREIDLARMLVLVVGGLIGLLLVLTSALLVYHWWDVFNGLKTLQGAESWRVWVAAIVLLAGLAGMFAALQVARSEERASVTLRRLVYGYNAVLTGVLLLAVLTVINVLAYVHLSKPYDWTSQSIYSLSSRSENVLVNLKKPTKIYAILSYGGEPQRRVQALLENCQAVNPKVQLEYLSPDLNRETVRSLGEKYRIGAREGLLVVYGSPPQEEHQFINDDALYNTRVSMSPGSGDNRFFKGESELMTTLSFLSEGKQKPAIYFTQGNGELELNDMSQRVNVGLAALKRQLEADNYTVKGLQFSSVEGAPSPGADVVSSVGVPSDAAVVIVAGAKRRLPDYALTAIRKYMEPEGKDEKPRGKLIVLFDQVLAPDKDQWVQTGLEDLLDKYNVAVGKDRVISRGSRSPLVVGAATIASEDLVRRNPLAAAFEGKAFTLYDTRTVQARTDVKPEDARFKAEAFLYVFQPRPFWAETDLRTPPEEWLKDDKIPLIRQKISPRPLPVGVLVTEESASRDPHQPASGDKKPRLVVLGTTTPVCNAGLRTPEVYDFVQSLLGWLRDKPADIGIEAKKQDVYVIGSRTNFDRMLYLPIFIMGFGVAGLGAAVWVVRRK